MTVLAPGTVTLRFVGTPCDRATFTVNGLPHENVGSLAELTEWLKQRKLSRELACCAESGQTVYRIKVGVRAAVLQEFCDRWVVPVAVTEPPRPRSCQGKLRCNDRAEADSRARSLMLSPSYQPKIGFTIRTYHCQHCGGWHVGHAKIGE